MRQLEQKLAIARGEIPADLLLTNCRLVNVLSGEVHPASIAIADGRVIGLGDYPAERVLDLGGACVAPALIDGHFHVESSMLTVPEFARAVVPHGTGAVVLDPHEYANVLGLDGIRYVLESSRGLPLEVFLMLPSCVPATEFETAGARLTAEDLRLMIADERVAGVAELMNYPGVFLGDPRELAKIAAGKGKCIDGHAPGLTGRNLNAYVLAGVQSDHESTELEEARAKLRLGLHLLLREGSTERNLATLAPLVTPANAANCSFATDDKLAADLVNEGHIDHALRVAIRGGMPPVTAFQIATINPARHYRLRNLGALAPRYWADFIVFDDLTAPVVRQTWKKGVLVAEEGRYLAAAPEAVPLPRSTMNLRYRAPEDFVVPAAEGARMRIIEIVPHQIVTREAIEPARVEAGCAVADVGRDLLKLVVVERHRATGNVGVGFVRGFRLRRGALASTVAHDAHNVVAVGASDADLTLAIRELERMQGGLVAVADGEVLARLPLPVAGLVSDRPLAEVVAAMDALNAAAASLGSPLAAPFMTLSFLSLSPIPELKLTDQGLIDARAMQRTSLFV
jgi:adenine deaminase